MSQVARNERKRGKRKGTAFVERSQNHPQKLLRCRLCEKKIRLVQTGEDRHTIQANQRNKEDEETLDRRCVANLEQQRNSLSRLVPQSCRRPRSLIMAPS